MDYQGSSVPFASIGRSILSIRRESVDNTNHHHHDYGSGQDQELDSFQKHVADLFSDLHSTSSDDLLSLLWIRKLLDVFLICQEQFRVILFNSKNASLSKPPLDRFINDFFDRTVKALDICNAVRDGIDQISQWKTLLSIVISSIKKDRPIGEGQIRRAKKALTDLTMLMLDEKDSTGTGLLSHRNRSFNRNTPKESKKGHFRSLSWSVSRSWSAGKQLQAISNNLYAPRQNEITQTSGLAIPVYTMSSVVLFVMWTLVAAIPCQDRGLQTHFSIPRNFAWAAPVLGVHEKVMEESKKKDRKNSVGLLREIHQIEKCTRQLMDVLDAASVPVEKEREGEMRMLVGELEMVVGVLKEGLEPLERQVREVFHRIVRSRTEGLDCMGKSHTGE